MITVLRVIGFEFFHPVDYKIRMSMKAQNSSFCFSGVAQWQNYQQLFFSCSYDFSYIFKKQDGRVLATTFAVEKSVCKLICSHASYYNLLPLRVCNIFPHYLIKDMIFWKKLLTIKCVFLLSKISSEMFLILRRIERDVMKMCIGVQ